MQAIRDETHKNFEYALKTILRCAESPPRFYAKASFTSFPSSPYLLQLKYNRIVGSFLFPTAGIAKSNERYWNGGH